jgi:hypothetical protein
MSIQEREYMRPGKSERQKQREYADKFLLQPATDYNNQEHWDININQPKPKLHYNDVRFDESDYDPNSLSPKAKKIFRYCAVAAVLYVIVSFTVIIPWCESNRLAEEQAHRAKLAKIYGGK